MSPRIALLLSIFLLPSLTLHSSVEHKSEFIDRYLGNISSNLHEKTELAEYIQRDPDGTYLDIGTGGDAIAVILSQIPLTARTNLIAADLDPMVLEAIKIRRPEIMLHMNSPHGPRISLIPMSATAMKPIRDSSLSGIGASALAHEIFSYEPVREPLYNFVSEVVRVLEKDGVMVYRDPRWVDEPSKICSVALSSEIAKYYSVAFLSRFLDRHFSTLVDYKGECLKPRLHDSSHVTVTCSMRNRPTSCTLSWNEFISTPSSRIDWDRPFSMEAPLGLIAEIQRHFVMYLKNYFGAGFIGEGAFKEQAVRLSDLSREEASVLTDYAKRNRLTIDNGTIPNSDYPQYLAELQLLRQAFRNGLSIESPLAEKLLENLSEAYGEFQLNRNLLFLRDAHHLVIDPKLLSMMYWGREIGICPIIEQEAKLPLDLLEHLKLEGEEHYFYKTTDELIAFFAQASFYLLNDTSKHNYVLAPIHVDSIKERPRHHYTTLLKRHMTIVDHQGAILDPVTSKNIIHLQLQPLSRAARVWQGLIERSEGGFPKVELWTSKLQRSGKIPPSLVSAKEAPFSAEQDLQRHPLPGPLAESDLPSIDPKEPKMTGTMQESPPEQASFQSTGA